MKVELTAVYRNDGDWWVGYVEELPGANAQERTLPEVRESLKEAIRLVFEGYRELARQERSSSALAEPIAVDL